MINKLQLSCLIIVFVLLSGCFSGSKTRVLGNKVVPNNKNQEVVVNEVNFLDALNYGDTSDIEVLDIYKLIQSRKALFILTDNEDKIAKVYGTNICDSMNNRLTNQKYVCIAQPVNNFYQNAANYVNKEQNLEANKQSFTADFLITRLDYLIDKQQNNSGPLANLPYIDMVMFLNGNYLFLWGDDKYRAIELTKELENFKKSHSKKNDVFKIAVANDFAKDLLIKILEANNLTESVQIDTIDISSTNKVAKKNYQVIAYAGSTISSEMSDYILKNYPSYVPLGMMDSVISNTMNKNQDLSSYNVSNYYTTEELLRNINIKSSTSKMLTTNEDNKVDINNAVKEQTDLSSKPAFTKKKSYDQNDFSNSKFDFKVGTVPEILKVDTIVKPNDAIVNTIGIPNVLVATREASSLEIYNLLYSFIENHEFIKSSYITKDMRNFKIRDLIVSNLSKNNLIYSYGVTNFQNYYQSNSGKENISQAILDTFSIIKEKLKSVNVPPFYGPDIPSTEQVDVIDYQNKKRIILNKEIESVKSLQKIIDNIKNDIDGNKDNSASSSEDLNKNKSSSKENVSNNVVQNTVVQKSSLNSINSETITSTKPLAIGND